MRTAQTIIWWVGMILLVSLAAIFVSQNKDGSMLIPCFGIGLAIAWLWEKDPTKRY